MIRACLMRVAMISDSCNVAAIRRFSSVETARPRAKEIRECKLIGTILQNPMDVESGSKLITIKTMQPDNHYKIHRAFISSQKLLSMVEGKLSAGQRVYVSGELRCQPFLNIDNHQRQRISIQVNELYASKSPQTEANGSGDKTINCIDYNNVSMLSNISSDIHYTDNFARFYLSSNFSVRNSADGNNNKVAFYNIFVHNQDLINYLKENLQKRDRVFINGVLNSKPELDQNNKKSYGGYIEATNIIKVDRFLELSSENSIEESYKTATEWNIYSQIINDGKTPFAL